MFRVPYPRFSERPALNQWRLWWAAPRGCSVCWITGRLRRPLSVPAVEILTRSFYALRDSRTPVYVSISALETRLRRARQQLRQILNGDLRAQLMDLLLMRGIFRRPLFNRASGEQAGKTGQRDLAPARELVGVDAVLGGELAHGLLLSEQRLHRLGFELGAMALTPACASTLPIRRRLSNFQGTSYMGSLVGCITCQNSPVLCRAKHAPTSSQA